MFEIIKSFCRKHHRILFYTAWFLINFFQALTTELFDDEAYYWVYSIFPAWGYFDHPPMIAMLIKAGFAIFHNELGVRFFVVVLNTASIYLIDRLTEKKDPILFYAVCSSIALAQLGGAMAVPDTPLMFFVALFFWLYKRFEANMNMINTLLMGLSIALMLYTKYHGVLVVLFTALSNARLWRSYQSYLAVLVAVVLFIPHFYWQHLNGYPSVQFHLFERNSDVYQFKVTLEFIGGQILLAGPIAGWLLLFAAWKKKPVSVTEKALRFTFIGIYLFFLASTLKGRAEANWTIPAFIGLIVLSHQYLRERARLKKWLYYTLPFTLILVFAARIMMLIDIPPAWWIRKDEVHQNKNWVGEIREAAAGLPVVFINSYQKPSKYWYYAQDTSMALNSPAYRRNNYNFWKIEDSIIGQPVYVAGPYKKDFLNTKFNNLQLDGWGGRKIDRYFSFSRLLIEDVNIKRASGNRFHFNFKTVTPAHYLPFFSSKPYDSSRIYLTVYHEKKPVKLIASTLKTGDIKTSVQTHSAQVDFKNLSPGDYAVKFSISTCLPYWQSLNSSGFPITIK